VVDQHPDEGRFAGTVRTQKSEDLAGLDREGEIGDSPVSAPVGVGEAVSLDDVVVQRISSSVRR
jgi:hypothetical protein